MLQTFFRKVQTSWQLVSTISAKGIAPNMQPNQSKIMIHFIESYMIHKTAKNKNSP